MLLIAATATSIAIVLFIIAMLGIAFDNSTNPYDEYVFDMIFFIIGTIAMIISAVLLWIAYGKASSAFALAASIVLTVFLLVNVFVFPIPLILSYIGFGMQNKINKEMISITENHNQDVMF